MKCIFPALTIIMSLVASCSSGGPVSDMVHEECNSVYYWKTVFNLDNAGREFLRTHDIKRLYLRMFDVSVDAFATTADGKAVPNASVRVGHPDYFLRDSLSVKEFVPVVYITLDALKAMKDKEAVLALNIVERVRNMCEYNAIPGVREIQLDCDWTASTEKSFFSLCESIGQSISKLNLPWRVSSTIRLHQLSRKAPPVSNGVLMVYNTGSFNDPDAENSIISATDVKPYLAHLPEYPLHLDVAYPAYSWQLLFRKRTFVGLLNGLNLQDSTQFLRRADNVYVARRDVPYRSRVIFAGDVIREESSDYSDISEVKSLIDKAMSRRPHSNILYHLDSDNLSKYSENEIERIFSNSR